MNGYLAAQSCWQAGCFCGRALALSHVYMPGVICRELHSHNVAAVVLQCIACMP